MNDQNRLKSQSDIAAYLANRYNTFLKNKETPENHEIPQKEEASDSLTAENKPDEEAFDSSANTYSALSGAEIPAASEKQVQDKIDQFYRLISTTVQYPSKERLKFEYQFSEDDFALLKKAKLDWVNMQNSELFEKISLDTEDGHYLFYYKKYALKKINELFNIYIDQKDYFETDDFNDSFGSSLLMSELKNDLELEGQFSLKRKIHNSICKQTAGSSEEHLARRLISCYRYIQENPITEENLFKLHAIVAENLSEKEIHRYRGKNADIDEKSGFPAAKGAAPHNIEKYMHKLFAYIDYSLRNYDAAEAYIASVIIHYYFICISPYSDNNFRIARLLSQWYILNHPNIPYKPLFISEALNNDIKSGKYLKAIEDAREFSNDVTFLINYMVDIVFKYFIIYLNLGKISSKTMSSGIELSKGEENAIKTILSMPYNEGGYFDWKRYKKFDHSELSKQYYNRILNHLETKGILESVTKNSKLYRLKFEQYDLLKL